MDTRPKFKESLIKNNYLEEFIPLEEETVVHNDREKNNSSSSLCKDDSISKSFRDIKQYIHNMVLPIGDDLKLTDLYKFLD